MTLYLLILQVLTVGNVGNIDIPVVPPDVTLVFSILQQVLAVENIHIKEILRDSRNSYLLKPYYMYNLRTILLRATSHPRRDSRSFDFESSLDEVKENGRAGSPPRRDSRCLDFTSSY